MKILPAQKKRNLNNDVIPNPKKLKRLPHVFAKVLELPFNSNADVFVQETQDSFFFIASGDGEIVLDDFQAHVVKILPGVTKVSVLKVTTGSQEDSLVDESDMDMWRFRLPSSACPEMASAVCTGGQLVVTVPKVVNAVEDNSDYGNSDDDEFWNSDVGGKKSLFVVE